MSGPYFAWHRLVAVVVKEFIQMRRDRVTFAMMLAVPIMQLLLFGFAISFVWLGKIGAGPGTDPVETIIGRFLTAYYFLFFLTMPVWTKLDKTKPVPERVTTHD